MVAVPSIGRATAVTPRPPAPEADATRRLYDTYGRQILNFCVNQLGNRQEAEDATQTTFLNAFRGLQRGIEPEFESAWLFKIAHNVCLTRQRSSYRRRRVESPGDLDALQDLLPSPQQDTDELIRLDEALHGMPEQQRRALLLREWQGLSYKEIGEELELSQAAVETLLFRARRSLATGLTEEAPTKGLRKRLRAGGDVGSLAALVKTLLFSGGVKVVAAVATVAATSAVAAAPAARHAIEHAVSPPQLHVAQPASVAYASASAAVTHAPSPALRRAASVTPVEARSASASQATRASAHAAQTVVHPLALRQHPVAIDAAAVRPTAMPRVQRELAPPVVATPDAVAPLAPAPLAAAPPTPTPEPPQSTTPPERTPAAAGKPDHHADEHPAPQAPAPTPTPTGSKQEERKTEGRQPDPQAAPQPQQDRGHAHDGGTAPGQAKQDSAPAPVPAPPAAPASVTPVSPVPAAPAPSSAPGKSAPGKQDGGGPPGHEKKDPAPSSAPVPVPVAAPLSAPSAAAGPAPADSAPVAPATPGNSHGDGHRDAKKGQ